MQDHFDLFEKVNDFLSKYAMVITICVLVTLSGLSFYAFTAYRQRSAGIKAYKALIKLEKALNVPVKNADDTEENNAKESFSSDLEKWEQIEQLANSALAENDSSLFGGHFSLFKIEALLKQGKTTEALDCINFYLPKIDKSPVKDLLGVKKALIQLDSNDEILQTEALQILKNIAHANSLASDAAYFWLGEHHWIKGETEEARSIWNSLVTEYSNHKNVTSKNEDSLFGHQMFQSPWVEKAKEKLKLIQ